MALAGRRKDACHIVILIHNEICFTIIANFQTDNIIFPQHADFLICGAQIYIKDKMKIALFFV